MRDKTKGHTFKEKGSSANHNLRGRLSDRLVLKTGSRKYAIEGGTEYCIFRKLHPQKYDTTVAVSFFVSDDEVLNVLVSGRVKRRLITSSAKL